jgi:wobble nucleotide-excising tRNase
MTAYELADQVEMWGEDLLALNMKGGIPVVQGAKMLRQQAKELDRAVELYTDKAIKVEQLEKELTEAGGMIGVLREYISDLEKGLESSIAMNKAQAERAQEK